VVFLYLGFYEWLLDSGRLSGQDISTKCSVYSLLLSSHMGDFEVEERQALSLNKTGAKPQREVEKDGTY